MKTGFSLCTFPNREKPVSITWEPCNENWFFPVWEKYRGKTLFWPCTGLQCKLDRGLDGEIGHLNNLLVLFGRKVYSNTMSNTKLPILLLLKAKLKCLPSLILFFTLDLYKVKVCFTQKVLVTCEIDI